MGSIRAAWRAGRKQAARKRVVGRDSDDFEIERFAEDDDLETPADGVPVGECVSGESLVHDRDQRRILVVLLREIPAPMSMNRLTRTGDS